MEKRASKLNITEIKQETFKEKIFRILAIMMIVIFPLALLCCFRVVKQYKRAVILRFGRVRPDSPAGPGIIWVVPCTDNVLLIDLRTQSFNLPPQEILTKDSVTVTVDAVVYFHVVKPLNCLLNVQSNKRATELIATAILRNILGQYTLTELLTSREIISHTARKEIDKLTAEWGVEMERVEIKDVILPFELQKAMAAEAEGTRLAKAKVIEAEGEIKAAENLKEASRIMMENPKVMLVRYLQTLNFIASQQSTSIFFPLPLEIPEAEDFMNQNGYLSPTVTMPSSESLEKLTIIKDVKSEEDAEKITRPSKCSLDPELYLQANDGIISKESLQKRRRIQSIRYDDKWIEKFLVFLAWILVIICFPFSLFCIFVVVRQFERTVILRNGKVRKNRAFGPGLIFYLPCVDTVRFIDLRIICYSVPPQEALTKDSLTVSVDAVVYYKIRDPVWAIINITDYKLATQYLAATTLRNALGTKKLSELLVNRPAISYQVFLSMKHYTKEWGVRIVRVEIKDISLPLQLQKAMAAEAESSRLANAKIIVAKAEIESTKSLQKATAILMDNPMCMQLRYLQSLHMIAGDKTHTIVYPSSLPLMKQMFK